MFIGREDELKFLEDKYHTDEGQFIVVYGRRRVGKTELLREFCKDKPHIFYTCTEISDEQQLKPFVNVHHYFFSRSGYTADVLNNFSSPQITLILLNDIFNDE